MQMSPVPKAAGAVLQPQDPVSRQLRGSSRGAAQAQLSRHEAITIASLMKSLPPSNELSHSRLRSAMGRKLTLAAYRINDPAVARSAVGT
jgi:hypothetical protein